MERAGIVYLVGAGPGARDLITVRGLACLRRAEVVVFDELCNHSLLDEAPPRAERIWVGKRGREKSLEQDEISTLLVERARAGLVVVRLKAGDPYVFGRGGEEALALARAGLAFEVVPGVTSAVAVPAYAGVPLTLKGLASSFEVRSGHSGEAEGRPTAVVLMGQRRLVENVDLLRAQGYPADLPAAVIDRGTRAAQRTVVATLGTIAQAAADLPGPALLVVGEVVKLRQELAWFERRPLFGQRVLVTRSRHQADETCRVLEELGAETVALPTIAIGPPADQEPLRRAVAALGSYQVLILTSANSVAALGQALEALGLDARALAGLTVCAIGPGTAEALLDLGVKADLVPDDHRAEGILELLPAERVGGKRVLLPRAARAREVLPRTLEERGATVDVVTAYETGLPDAAETRAGLEALARGEVDILTFTSASTAENFARIVGPRLGELTAGKLIAAIGPITADACRRLGLEVHVQPATYTIAALAEALVAHLGRARTGHARPDDGP